MPSTSTPLASSLLRVTSATTDNGVTHIVLNFWADMSKGSGSIFITDGAVQNVIDRVTGQPTLRVVGATFTKVVSLDQVRIGDDGKDLMFDAAGLPPGASLNVYMSAGTLLSGGKAVSALTVPGTAAFTTPAVVVEPPPVFGADIALDGGSLKSGQDITVTITFSKPVPQLDRAALSAGNASIGELTSKDGGKVWEVTLTGAAATNAPDNVLRLDMALVTADDGSHGTGIRESEPYLVDTLVAAHIDPVIQMFEDNGPDDMDGITNDDTMGVGGILHGPLQPGEFIELVINGRPINASKVETFANTHEPGTYFWYYSGEEGERFNTGENAVQARIVGLDGHSSLVASKTIIVERDAPDIVSKPGGVIDVTKAITITFDEAMYWKGHAESSGEIEIVDGFGNTSWIDMNGSMLSEDGKTLTLTPAEHNLATGNSYSLTLPDSLTDLAGNGYAGPAIAFSTAGDYQDKAAPRLVQLYVANGSGIYGKGDVLDFRLRYTEKVTLDAGTTPELYLDNGKVARYAGLTADGKEMIFTYTIEAGDDIDNLDYADPSWTLYGKVRDAAGNVFRQEHDEYEGLTTADGKAAKVAIDTVAATPGAPQLHASSEASAPGTNSTTDTAPRLTGSGAEAYATIAIHAGDIKVGSATADADGNWDTVLTTALSTGIHQLTVTQQDRAGNVSELSSALALTVAPPMPTSLAAPMMAASSDTGVSNSDGLTQLEQPGLAGKGPANTALTLKHNGAFLTNITTDANGDWSTILPSLAEGEHGFSVHLGESLASPTLSITVDRTRPAVAASPDGATHFNPNGDIVIRFSEAVHIAAAEGDGDMLVLVDAHNNQQKIALGDLMLSSDKRTLTIGADKHNLEALTDYRVLLPTTLTDLAGNAMNEYGIAFRTDNGMLPSAVRAIVSGDHSYRAGDTISFRIRFNEQVEKSGASELSLGLSNGARAAFTGISGNEAVFSYTVASGQDIDKLQINDTSMLVGRFADLSGNLLDSAHIEFTSLYTDSGYGNWTETTIGIDTKAPTAPDLPLLHADSNSGSALDLLTKDTTPTLAGTNAEAYARIEIYEGTTLLGFDYADRNGDWILAVEAGRELADGTHQLTVKQTDEAGNSSLASAPLSVTVDTTAPAAPPELLLATASDTGASDSDGVTSNPTPTFTGSGALANTDIALYVDGVEVGRTVSSDAGTWSIALAPGKLTAEKSYSFTATQFDAAGNESPASSAFKLVLDSAALTTTLTAPDLDAASDTGVSISDNITKDSTPTFSGIGAQANSIVALMVGSSEVGRAVADASGNWSITSSALADGTHQFRVRQLDPAGNQGPDSAPLEVTIDNVGPTPGTSSVNVLSSKFILPFNESIVFTPSGRFKLLAGSTELASYLGNNSSGWSVTQDSDGDWSVLNFNISLKGLLKMQWTNGSVTDLAGNLAEITGTPEWTFTL